MLKFARSGSRGGLAPTGLQEQPDEDDGAGGHAPITMKPAQFAG